MNTPSTYLSTRQVCERFGDINRMWIYRAVREHGFPPPLRLPGASGYLYAREAIETWESQRVAVQACGGRGSAGAAVGRAAFEASLKTGGL
jgi:predicted DNA-binding transcriptional regulator AlpA